MSALSHEKELFDELAARLASAAEEMTTQKVSYGWDPLPGAPASGALRWCQPFKPFPGAVWIAAMEADWMAAGKAALSASGIEQADAGEYRSAFLEIGRQSLLRFAQSLTRLAKQEVTLDGGNESGEAPAAKWVEIHIKAVQTSFAIAVGLEETLLFALAELASIPNGVHSHPAQLGVAFGNGAASNPSKTFDLLLDVELPVSVSFGRAQIPLKDVLKLTTGSIVELNRSIIEPVEIIVNNCVIARGEVVVVDGNFGVRVHAVISRQERLRTLQ